MHDLITGGTGFIGRALCQKLLALGHRVTVSTRSIERASSRLPVAADCVETLQRLQDVDVIYNLAGENLAAGRWTAARKKALYDSRIDSTKRLLSWIEKLPRKPRVLVSASAIGYYGPHGDEIISEGDPPGNDFSACLCRAWEAEAHMAQDLGVRVCITRIGIVLGADGGILGKILPTFRLGLGGRFGSGRQWMSWIHRADLIRLFLWLAQTETALGPYNATGPRPVTNREFTRTLGRVLRKPALMPVPASLLKIVLGEMSDLLVSGQKVLPQRAQKEGFSFHHTTLGDALNDLLTPSLTSDI